MASLTRGARDAFLGVDVAEAEVTKLGVQDEVAVGEDGAADAGADGQQQDGAGNTVAGAETDLGQAGRIGVVEADARADPSLPR